jgi:hypothetical protein
MGVRLDSSFYFVFVSVSVFVFVFVFVSVSVSWHRNSPLHQLSRSGRVGWGGVRDGDENGNGDTLP